ncbi:MAG TPA: HAD family phosphatase [Candidatus Sulfotelmatobacter sp.]|nr:HAD family phosphatase [Candidatus Sulfotelmatobacter sp.]
MKNPKALIFDMDGVLVDSEPLHERAKRMAFEEAGIRFPQETYHSYKGRPDVTMFNEVLAGRSVEEIAELLHRKHQFFEKIEHELQPIPGAVEFIRWAHDRYRLALATSATPRNRAAALQSLKIADCFESLVDTARFQRPKPDPEIFQVAMHDLQLSAADCWIIEDSLPGVRAGKAAGSFTVAITTTFDSVALSTAGADLIVDSFSKLRSSMETGQDKGKSR